jgi:hypothetical protein
VDLADDIVKLLQMNQMNNCPADVVEKILLLAVAVEETVKDMKNASIELWNVIESGFSSVELEKDSEMGEEVESEESKTGRIGVATLEYRVTRTVGEGITELNNTRGFSIDFATATTVFFASFFGMPVSTTHTVVGAVTGVGMARRLEVVNVGILKSIAISWLVTVPFAAGVGAIIYKLLTYY